MSTMRNLSISILEFVLSQPAHKLPAVIDLEQCPFPHGEIPLEEVLEEIVRLQSSGLIEANVFKGIDGKPCKAQIRYVTLGGKSYLQGSNPGAVPWSFLKKIPSSLLVILAFAILIGLLLLSGLGRRNGHVVQVATPGPAPQITPAPTQEPATNPVPEATPAPTATPTPTPAPPASPRLKPRATPHTSPDAKPANASSPKTKPRETPRATAEVR